MTTYTVYSPHDSRDAISGLSIDEAAREILTDDGQEFEIRQDDDGVFRLWYCQPVAGIRWSETVVRSFESDPAAAEADIYRQVIEADWEGEKIAVPDEQFAAMQAQIAAEGKDE